MPHKKLNPCKSESKRSKTISISTTMTSTTTLSSSSDGKTSSSVCVCVCLCAFHILPLRFVRHSYFDEWVVILLIFVFAIRSQFKRRCLSGNLLRAVPCFSRYSWHQMRINVSVKSSITFLWMNQWMDGWMNEQIKSNQYALTNCHTKLQQYFDRISKWKNCRLPIWFNMFP